MDDIDHEMRFVNLLGKFGPLCGTRWGQAQLKLNLRDLLMQLSTLVSAVVALESAPASATLNRRCSGAVAAAASAFSGLGRVQLWSYQL